MAAQDEAQARQQQAQAQLAQQIAAAAQPLPPADFVHNPAHASQFPGQPAPPAPPAPLSTTPVVPQLRFEGPEPERPLPAPCFASSLRRVRYNPNATSIVGVPGPETLMPRKRTISDIDTPVLPDARRRRIDPSDMRPVVPDTPPVPQVQALSQGVLLEPEPTPRLMPRANLPFPFPMSEATPVPP